MDIQTFSQADILNFEKRFRTQFVNALSGFKSGNLIGTVSLSGVNNLAIFTSVVHIGANPPLMGMISRPNSVPRHTLENIEASRFFTINHIHRSFYAKAHQTSARYSVDEFSAVGLTPDFKDFNAPYVQEANIQIGLEYVQRINIEINNTIMIIGRIVEVHLPNEIIEPDGTLAIEKAGTIAVSGLNTYHTTQKLEQLPYAKP